MQTHGRNTRRWARLISIGVRRTGPSFPLGGCGKLTAAVRRSVMRVKVLLQITAGDGAPGELEEIASLTKSVDRPEDLGLSLAESLPRARRCSPAPSTGSSRRKPRPGPRSGAAAKHAAGPAAARAATRLCSAPSSATCVWRALAFTAVPAMRATGRPPPRRSRSSSPITSRRSASTWRHAGLRSFPTRRRLSC